MDRPTNLCRPGRESTPPRITRRRFIGGLCAGLIGAPALAGLYAWRVEPHWIELVRRDLPIVGLPDELVGTRLVQLSDLHIGSQVDDDYVRQVFRRVRALSPDFVVMTGDWINFDAAPYAAKLDSLLKDFPRGRLATVGVLGNHDFGHNWSQPEVGAAVAGIAAGNGITVLRNQAVRFGGLRFVGLDDIWGPHFAPQRVPQLFAAGEATVALCHNPDAADQTIWGDFGGWILAGHTHGGQCKPPFLPPPILPVRNPRYTSGAFALADGRRLYINRGVGHLLRVRFNVRPEATVFRLRPAGIG